MCVCERERGFGVQGFGSPQVCVHVHTGIRPCFTFRVFAGGAGCIHCLPFGGCGGVMHAISSITRMSRKSHPCEPKSS